MREPSIYPFLLLHDYYQRSRTSFFSHDASSRNLITEVEQHSRADKDIHSPSLALEFKPRPCRHTRTAKCQECDSRKIIGLFCAPLYDVLRRSARCRGKKNWFVLGYDMLVVRRISNCLYGVETSTQSCRRHNIAVQRVFSATVRREVTPRLFRDLVGLLSSTFPCHFRL